MCHYILPVNEVLVAQLTEPTHLQTNEVLVGADEMAATILLVARFAGFTAEWLFFAVAHGAEAIGRDTQRDEILLHGGGATISQAEVVFGGAALIAMAFDGGFNVWIGTENFGGCAKGLTRIGADVGFIQIEVGVFDLFFENLVSGTIRIGGLGIRDAGDGNAYAGIGGAAGTCSGNGVRC